MTYGSFQLCVCRYEPAESHVVAQGHFQVSLSEDAITLSGLQKITLEPGRRGYNQAQLALAECLKSYGVPIVLPERWELHVSA